MFGPAMDLARELLDAVRELTRELRRANELRQRDWERGDRGA